jgi:hypothetical protein
MMEGKWIRVFSSSDPFRVEVLKGLLSEHSIESVVVNKKDSAYLFGEVELYVNVTDAFLANQIISNSES